MIAEKDIYSTDPQRSRSLFSRVFLSPHFMLYPQIFCIVWVNGRKALKGRYGNEEWASSSLDIMRALENIGVRIEITGMDNIRRADGPVVFIANHMSTLETLVLPSIIQPLKTATFIVKKSLITMPVFGPVMRSRDPIVVGRENPREDLRAVLEKGTEKLGAGISIVVFPQSTRAVEFRPEEFNTLGVKLAAKAGVPVVPIALKTDAWGIGRHIKEFGPVDPAKKVFFAFGDPMHIKGRGTEEHEKVVAFIQERLAAWEKA